jgi:predicted DsbA family dithiol-disulfide isomerase
MKVEIWSDVMCPFCYIGKRKFEKALEHFDHKDKVEIEWKSFQLDPNLKTDPNKSTLQHLAQNKGWSQDYAQQMLAHVTDMAKDEGLTYNMDKSVVANSFDAHRFSHLAKKHGLQDAAEEKLFLAYFTEGKNTADHETLVQIGTDIGLDAAEVRAVLSSDTYADEVQQDIYQAQQVGVRGVPFFVVNQKYAVSGAQPSETFLGLLNKVWQEEQPATLVNVADGNSCSTDGVCE